MSDGDGEGDIPTARPNTDGEGDIPTARPNTAPRGMDATASSAAPPPPQIACVPVLSKLAFGSLGGFSAPIFFFFWIALQSLEAGLFFSLGWTCISNSSPSSMSTVFVITGMDTVSTRWHFTMLTSLRVVVKLNRRSRPSFCRFRKERASSVIFVTHQNGCMVSLPVHVHAR